MSGPVRIGVLGDTHALSFSEVPRQIREALETMDVVVHVGDFTNGTVVEGFRSLKNGSFHGVHGNTDTREVRDGLPSRQIVEIAGRRIAITHPVEGGPSEEVEDLVIAAFAPARPDIIIYGHSHDARMERRNGLLLFNPGKAYLPYSSFEAPASYGVLTLGDTVRGEIVFI